MATLYNLRDDVLNLAQRFARVDDERLSEGQVFLWIKGYRNQLLPKYTDYGKIDTEHYAQDLGVCKLETVDAANSPYKSWGMNVKKFELPPLAALPERRYITFLGGIDKGLTNETTSIALYPSANIGAASTIALIQHMVKATVIGHTLYIVNYEGDYVNVRAILSDPTKAKYYSSDSTWIPFNPATWEYPIGEDMGREIVDLIMTREFRIGMSTPKNVGSDGASES